MKFDIARTVTDQIIAMIENGQADGKWEAPWNKTFAVPSNAQTGNAYRGINVLLLWGAASSKGYTSNIWGTWNQWKKMGYTPENAKGQGVMIVFWKILEKKERKSDGTEKIVKIPFLRYSRVFNADLVPDYEAPKMDTLSESERLEHADNVIADTGANISHDGGASAFYRPMTDSIHLPKFESFKTPEGYYSTAFHELAHWTGSKPRLDRDLTGRFGDESYAMEELVAELSAAFTCAELGITPETRQDHAKYIKSWLRKLKDDKNAIFTAASKAAQATKYIVEDAGQDTAAEAA